MNIYQKLATARVKLQERGLQKTGKNQRFNYFELKDFLPAVNEIFNELKLCSVVSYDNEFATLTIFDGEKEDKIVFTSPMVQRALPSGTDIQNLGAIQTYQRRYLYLTALEIAENDLVDPLDTSKEKPTTKPKSPPNSNKPPQQNTNSGQFDPVAEFHQFRNAAEKAQSLEELQGYFKTAWRNLEGTPQQQQAKDFYEVRKAEFEQENL